jgi:hypothetical protein
MAVSEVAAPATTPAAVAVSGEDGGEGGEGSMERPWSSASFMVTSCISCVMMPGESSVEIDSKECVKK